MGTDIDKIIERFQKFHPEVTVDQLKVTHSADDNGLWFFKAKGSVLEVQLESSSGNCPFLIESNAHPRRLQANSIEEAINVLIEELNLH
jgi:hypothetical protein